MFRFVVLVLTVSYTSAAYSGGLGAPGLGFNGGYGGEVLGLNGGYSSGGVLGFNGGHSGELFGLNGGFGGEVLGLKGGYGGGVLGLNGGYSSGGVLGFNGGHSGELFGLNGGFGGEVLGLKGGYGGGVLGLNGGYGGQVLGLNGGYGASLHSGYGPIPAAIQSTRSYDLVPVALPYEAPVPQVIDVGPNIQPVDIIFRTQSSPLNVQQIHTPTPPQFESTRSEDETSVLNHENYRTIVQHYNEVIQPIRKIVQRIEPVSEHVHTVVAKGEEYQRSLPVAPVYNPPVALQALLPHLAKGSHYKK